MQDERKLRASTCLVLVRGGQRAGEGASKEQDVETDPRLLLLPGRRL